MKVAIPLQIIEQAASKAAAGATYPAVFVFDEAQFTVLDERRPMTKEQYMQFHRDCCARMVEITKKKNADYTGGSADPFSNFSQIGSMVQLPGVVEIGFLTRMSDKLSRIGSFVSKGTLQVADESIEDTLLDLANYCILFSGYLRSRKQAEGPKQNHAISESNFKSQKITPKEPWHLGQDGEQYADIAKPPQRRNYTNGNRELWQPQ